MPVVFLYLDRYIKISSTYVDIIQGKFMQVVRRAKQTLT